MKKKINKKALTVISTDWHLKESNIEEIKDLVAEKCKLAKSLGVREIFCLGDVFDTRAGQKISVLSAFSNILEIIRSYDIKLILISGNHDKQVLDVADSFITPFRHHPNFMYIDMMGGVPIDDVMIYMLPYFKEYKWVEEYGKLLEYIGDDFNDGKKHILFTHIATNSSVNNDGSKVNCNIAVNDFKNWDLVLLGHFHNYQQLGTNVYHIPAIKQHNFGENDNKGFTVLYDDLSFDIVHSTFKEYKRVVIDFDNTTKEELQKILKENKTDKKFVRLEFVSNSESVKLIEKDRFIALGFDVKVKVKEIERTIEYAQEEIKEYNASNIREEFKQFCDENEVDFEKNVIYLDKKIEKYVR